MQTQTRHKRASRRIRKDIPKKPARQIVRRRVSETASNSSIQCLGLPTLKFRSKPVLSTEDASEMSVSLRKAYSRYCRLCKVEEKELNGNDSRDIKVMYKHICSLVKQENRKAHINIEQNSKTGEYVFLVFHYYDFKGAIFAFPLLFFKLLKEQKHPLSAELISFCSFFLWKLQFSDTESNGHLGYTVQMALEEVNMGFGEDDEEASRDLIDSFNAYAHEYKPMLKRLKKEASSFNLPSFRAKLMKKHQVGNDDFREWMLEGVNLLSDKDCVPIPNLQFRVDGDEPDNMNDGTGVEIERQFIIVWADSDWILDYYIEGVNMDFGEFGSYDPMGWHFITKNTRKPYRHSAWPDKVCNWLNTGIVLIHAFIENTVKS